MSTLDPLEPPLARASALAPLVGKRTGSPSLSAPAHRVPPTLRGSDGRTPALWRPRLRRLGEPLGPSAVTGQRPPDFTAESMDESLCVLWGLMCG